jgi:hypothetical protein
MANSTLIFHLGYPKTGTTSLQNKVFPQLSNVAYVGRARQEYQPKLYKQHSDFLHQLYLDLYFSTGRQKEYETWVTNQLSINKFDLPMLISDEMLSSIFFMPLPLSTHVRQKLRARTGKRPLKDLFLGLHLLFGHLNRPIKIVYIIRNQSDLFFSLFAENYGAFARQGEKSLARFTDKTLENPLRFNQFNYHQLFTQLTAVFGRQNILIYPFESLTQEPKRFFEKLLPFTGAKGNTQDLANLFGSNVLNKRAMDSNRKTASPYRSTQIPYWAQDLRSGTKSIPILNKMVNRAVLPSIKKWHQQRQKHTFPIVRKPETDLLIRTVYHNSNVRFQEEWGNLLPAEYFKS